MNPNNITIEDLKSILDEKLAPLRSEVSQLRSKVEETTKFLDLTNRNYEEIKSKVARYESERKELIAENKILKSTVQTLEDKAQRMKESINNMEQYSRRDCLELHGIPVRADIDDNREDTNKIVTKIGELMNVQIGDEDISISHRLPQSKKYQGKRGEPPIIVKFTRREVKDRFYRARKKLRNITTQDLGFESSKHIYVNESLTEQNKDLFKECVKVKKELQFTFIWTSNGKIYLRKNESSPVHHINTKADLRKLLPR